MGILNPLAFSRLFFFLKLLIRILGFLEFLGTVLQILGFLGKSLGKILTKKSKSIQDSYQEFQEFSRCGVIQTE